MIYTFEGGVLLRRIAPRSMLGPVGTVVKVPSTVNPEEFVWLSACTNEVQNCRHGATVNTMILKEDLERHQRAQGNLLQQASH